MQTTKKVLLKIIILGDSSVGKTAILHKYVSGQFIEEHKATIGADFLTKEIPIDEKLVTLQIWDTAGQERFQSLGTAFYRGADACVLVYDVTNEKSFRQIDTWRSSFLEQANPEDEAKFPFLLIGNKIDLNSERKVDKEDGERLAQRHQMIFYETSALSGKGVEPAIRAIASTASDMETVPYFTEELANRILREDETTGGEGPSKEAGCACTML